MDKVKLASELVRLAKELVSADTFECPNCGTKVLEKTHYCVKCKKKVKEASRLAADLSKKQEEYRDFFMNKLESYNVGSPSELDEEDKKDFFNEIEKDWDGEDD